MSMSFLIRHLVGATRARTVFAVACDGERSLVCTAKASDSLA